MPTLNPDHHLDGAELATGLSTFDADQRRRVFLHLSLPFRPCWRLVQGIAKPDRSPGAVAAGRGAPVARTLVRWVAAQTSKEPLPAAYCHFQGVAPSEPLAFARLVLEGAYRLGDHSLSATLDELADPRVAAVFEDVDARGHLDLLALGHAYLADRQWRSGLRDEARCSLKLASKGFHPLESDQEMRASFIEIRSDFHRWARRRYLELEDLQAADRLVVAAQSPIPGRRAITLTRQGFVLLAVRRFDHAAEVLRAAHEIMPADRDPRLSLDVVHHLLP